MKKKDIIKAIKKNEVTIEAYLDLMDDETIVLAACKQDPKNFKYASNVIKNNARIATFVLKEDHSLLGEVGEVLRSDDAFIWPYIKKDIEQLPLLGIALKEDADFQIRLLKAFGPDIIKHLSAPLKHDRAFFKKAIQKGHVDALKHAPAPIKDDADLASLAISLGGKPKHIGKNLKSSSVFITKLFETKALKTNDTLSWVSDEIKADKKFFTTHLTDKPHLLKTANHTLQQSKGFLLKLGAPTLSNVFNDIDDALKEDPIFIEQALKVDDKIKDKLSKKMKKTFNIK